MTGRNVDVSISWLASCLLREISVTHQLDQKSENANTKWMQNSTCSMDDRNEIEVYGM